MLARTILIYFFSTCLAYAVENSSVSGLLHAGDRAYANHDNKTALVEYRRALQADTLNFTAAWKTARAYVDVGERFSEKNDRKQYFRKAEQTARKAVALAPDSVQGHLFLSVAMGNIALLTGAKQRVRLAHEIKSAVDRALELDPENAVAWHVLGRWHREVATVGWLEKRFAALLYGGIPADASLESAVKCFRRAIALEPDFIHHHYELAVTLEKLDRTAEAVDEYQKVISLPAGDADDDLHKQNARSRLEKLR
jgi:tetratricopeptide (TPR) repeat protein